MNETIQTMLSRRSVRSYTRDKVPDESLDLILECALYAPSGRNHQVVRFTTIEKREILDDLVAIVRSELAAMPLIDGQYLNATIAKAQKNPGYDFSFGAPALVIVTAPVNWPNGMADSANALQNMHLAAAALGLGACWVNQLHWLTDNEVLRGYLRQYGIDDGQEIYGSMVFGNTNLPLPKAAPRKPNRVLRIS